MPKVVIDKARTAIAKMRRERFTLTSISRSLRTEYAADYDVPHLSRVASGDRHCSAELELMLIKLCKLLTGEKV